MLFPIAVNGNAAIIQIRRGAGEITILESLLYVDIDADGFDAEQEAQIGTSDEECRHGLGWSQR